MSLYHLFFPLSAANITGIMNEIHDLGVNEITEVEAILRDGESYPDLNSRREHRVTNDGSECS